MCDGSVTRVLMILEVSQKQAFIFGSNKLAENLTRSNVIRYVTDPAFFAAVCPDGFDQSANMVYTGGGHTVLQFPDGDAARAFAGAVSRAVLEQFPGVELFVKTMAYDDARTPAENLLALSQALEAKKSRRQAAFYPRSLGVEQPASPQYDLPEKYGPAPEAPQGWHLTTDGEALCGDDNFVAVVHIDGNAMGARVQNLYNAPANRDWDTCVAALRTFSESIDEDFDAAYRQTAAQIAQRLPEWPTNILPLRRVIGAGDDVCFLTAGSLGLEAAALFLQNLSARTNRQDQQPYAACAGVVLVHRKSPFRAAYDLSESLCRSAKRYGAQYDANGSLCLMDWHIEFGELPDSLAQIRSRYITRDGALLTLRPLVVCSVREPRTPPPPEHRYGYFTALMALFHKNTEGLARSKIKALRTAFSQGEVETELALRSMNLKTMQERGVELLYDWKDTLATKASGWMRAPSGAGREPDKRVFFEETAPDGTTTKHCRFFDVIELIDHFTPLGEEGTP